MAFEPNIPPIQVHLCVWGAPYGKIPDPFGLQRAAGEERMMGADALPSPLWGGSTSTVSEARCTGRGEVSAVAERQSASFPPPPRLAHSTSFHALADPPHKGEGKARAVSHVFQVAVLALCLAPASTALAACPIELSVYGDLENAAEINFTPTRKSAATTNTFRMLLDNDTVLDGVVLWSEGVGRPNGILMHKCPEGDATGDELAACTLWQGVIYTSDNQGNIELLPAEGAAAPEKLIFPDLGHSLRNSSAYGANGFSKVPWDVFAMKGCQE